MDAIKKQRLLKVIERLAIFFGTILLLYLIFKFAVYFMPFFIAAIIAIIVEPVIKFCMNKLKMSRRVSAIIVVILTIALFGFAIFYGSLSLIRETLELSTNLGPFITELTNKTQQFIGSLSERYKDIPPEAVAGIQNSIIEFLKTIGGIITSWAGKLLNMLLSVPTILINIIITILALIFFTKDRIYVIDMMEFHMPKSWIKKITTVVTEMFSALGGYVRVYAKIIIITFAELYLAFNIYRAIGYNVEYPFLLALLISIIDILPILGVGTVLVPWAIWLFVTGNPGFGMAIAITYFVIFVIRQFMEPKLVSTQFGIHPLVTLFAMYAGFKTAGVFGLILGPVALMLLKSLFAKQIEKGLFKDLFDEK